LNLDVAGNMAGLASAVGVDAKTARSLDDGATKATVGSRAEAEELFLGNYQGAGYRNASGFDGVGTKQYFGEKRGTYHWE